MRTLSQTRGKIAGGGLAGKGSGDGRGMEDCRLLILNFLRITLCGRLEGI